MEEDASSEESFHDKRTARAYKDEDGGNANLEAEEIYQSEGQHHTDAATERVFSRPFFAQDRNQNTQLGIYLARRTLARKVERQYTQTFVPLREFSYRKHRHYKDSKATQRIKKRGLRDPRTIHRTEFAYDADFYSQVNDKTVFGFDLLAVLRAMSVAETELKLVDKQGVRYERDRLSVRSNQILRGPLIAHGIDFETMYPHVTGLSAGTTIDDYVFTDLTADDLLDVKTTKNGNNARRMHRSIIKDRILPCYFLPYFLSGQSVMVAVCNSAMALSSELLLNMMTFGGEFTSETESFQHAVLQLRYNHTECLTQLNNLAISLQDIMLTTSHIRIAFNNFCERLRIYDYRCYKAMMTDPTIVSNVKMTMSKPDTTQGADDIPFVASTIEERLALFNYFEEFITKWESDHFKDAEKESMAVEVAQHYQNMDEFIQYMTYGSQIVKVQRIMFKDFCLFMDGIATQPRIGRELAVQFYQELCNAYRARMRRHGIQGDMLSTERAVEKVVDQYAELRAEEEARRQQQLQEDMELDELFQKPVRRETTTPAAAPEKKEKKHKRARDEDEPATTPEPALKKQKIKIIEGAAATEVKHESAPAKHHDDDDDDDDDGGFDIG